MNNKYIESGKSVVFTGDDKYLTNGNHYTVNEPNGGDYRFVIDNKGMPYEMKESRILSDFELLESECALSPNFIEPELMNEDSDQYKIQNAGNVLHNISCGASDDEQDELGALATYLWDLSGRFNKDTNKENLNPSADDERVEECLRDIAELFGINYGVDCGWGNLADEIEAKLKSTTCEAVKPIYTQAMCDAGEYPSVGMDLLFFKDSKLTKKKWTMGTFAGKAYSAGGCAVFLFVDHETKSTHVVELDIQFKPLTPPIKSDEEKLRDAIYYHTRNDKYSDEQNQRFIDDILGDPKFTVTLTVEGE